MEATLYRKGMCGVTVLPLNASQEAEALLFYQKVANPLGGPWISPPNPTLEDEYYSEYE